MTKTYETNTGQAPHMLPWHHPSYRSAARADVAAECAKAYPKLRWSECGVLRGSLPVAAEREQRVSGGRAPAHAWVSVVKVGALWRALYWQGGEVARASAPTAVAAIELLQRAQPRGGIL